jgi:exodeoxyribonuclease VII small subunit
MSEPEAGLSFEEAVGRLEEIVAQLESGALPLGECLRRFEQAVTLSRHCSAQLENAERQIRVLTAEGGLQPAAGIGWLEEAAGEPPDPLK